MTKRVRMLTMTDWKTETEKRDSEKKEREHGELRHCLAESPVISRSWTCRDCWRAGDRDLYYHCLPHWRDLRGERVPSGPLHSRHIYPHPSHTFLTYSHSWPVHLPLTLPPFQLMSHFKSQTILIRTKRSDRGKNIKVSSTHSKSLIVNICMFLSNVHFVAKICLFSCESISLLTVTERSDTCTLAAVNTSCWCSNKEHTHTYTVLLQQKEFLGTHVCMKFLPHCHTFFVCKFSTYTPLALALKCVRTQI